MGKSLTLPPECRECTSACPNKPAERRMRREQTPTNEGCQNECGAAPGRERSGDGRHSPHAMETCEGRRDRPRHRPPCHHPSTGSRAPVRKARDGWTKRKACGHGSGEAARPGQGRAGHGPRGSQGWSEEGSAKRDVPSPRQPRSQEIHGISPSAASLCSERRQHE